MAILHKRIHTFKAIPIKISVEFLTYWEADLQISYRNADTQENHENEEESWTTHILQFQSLLQSYSKQNNVVVTERKTYGAME